MHFHLHNVSQLWFHSMFLRSMVQHFLMWICRIVWLNQRLRDLFVKTLCWLMLLITNWLSAFQDHHIWRCHVRLKLLVYSIFMSADHSHQFHWNQIDDYHELNPERIVLYWSINESVEVHWPRTPRINFMTLRYCISRTRKSRKKTFFYVSIWTVSENIDSFDRSENQDLLSNTSFYGLRNGSRFWWWFVSFSSANKHSIVNYRRFIELKESDWIHAVFHEPWP
jgi:hypothetical protein